MITPKTEAFPWPTIKLDKAELLELINETDVPGNQYRWGGKVGRSATPEDVIRKGVDCSGLTWWLMIAITDGKVELPHGSVNQREWCEAQGFKRSTVEAAKRKDGVVRMAFLRPEDNKGVGHVAFVLDGETIESHGGAGPDRRPWTGLGWQASAFVFVLTAPGV